MPRAGVGALRAMVRLVRLVLGLLPRRARLTLAALLALASALGGGYLFWLRDSELVAVERVRITGVTRSDDADEVRKALEGAARGMTTLHLREDALERAGAAASPSVVAVTAVTDFPHGLTIHVRQHRPVALVEGRPVAADGTVLPRMPLPGPLPRFDGPAPAGGRVGSAATRTAVAVAGAAPVPLLGRITAVAVRPGRGLVVEVGEGPELVFGDARRLRAKWTAAARVLADPDSQGAAYIDLRLPERPSAGGLAAGGGPYEEEDPGSHPDEATTPQASIPGAAPPPGAAPGAATSPPGAAPATPSTPSPGPASNPQP